MRLDAERQTDRCPIPIPCSKSRTERSRRNCRATGVGDPGHSADVEVCQTRSRRKPEVVGECVFELSLGCASGKRTRCLSGPQSRFVLEFAFARRADITPFDESKQVFTVNLVC